MAVAGLFVTTKVHIIISINARIIIINTIIITNTII